MVVASMDDWDAMILEASSVEKREDTVTGRVVVSALVDPELDTGVAVTYSLEVVDAQVKDVELMVELV